MREIEGRSAAHLIKLGRSDAAALRTRRRPKFTRIRRGDPVPRVRICPPPLTNPAQPGAAAAAPAPNANSNEIGDGRPGGASGSVRSRVALLTKSLGKSYRKRTLEKEIGEAPPSRLERVGLLAERVARLRLARAHGKYAPKR